MLSGDIKDEREFLGEMRTQGWSRFDHVVPEPELAALRTALDDACAECRKVQLRKGLENTEGTAHHVLTFEGPFMDFLAGHPLDAQIEAFFQSRYILNS